MLTAGSTLLNKRAKMLGLRIVVAVRGKRCDISLGSVTRCLSLMRVMRGCQWRKFAKNAATTAAHPQHHVHQQQLPVGGGATTVTAVSGDSDRLVGLLPRRFTS